MDLRDQALEKLADQLRAYQGLGPDAVAVLQREHAAMSAEKVGVEGMVRCSLNTSQQALMKMPI